MPLLPVLFLRPDVEKYLSTLPSWLVLALPCSVLLLGLALFGTFFSQHAYMRIYKYWMGTLEGKILLEFGHSVSVPDKAASEKLQAHKGTLYCDENKLYIPWERTLVFIMLLFTGLTVGVSCIVAVSLHVPLRDIGYLAASGVAFHIFLVVVLPHFLKKPALGGSEGNGSFLCTPAQQSSKGHISGNAIQFATSHRGWFVGHFMTGRHPLVATRDIEVKWGVHKVGEAMKEWAEGSGVHAMSVLIRGDFFIQFDDAEYHLANEGDFVMWGPGLRHKWRANEDTLIITVRWPSVPV